MNNILSIASKHLINNSFEFTLRDLVSIKQIIIQYINNHNHNFKQLIFNLLRGIQLTVTELSGTWCFAITQPVCKSELKYSTEYPISGLELDLVWILDHIKVTLLLVMLMTFGSLGGGGNEVGSGVRCSALEELFSTYADEKIE